MLLITVIIHNKSRHRDVEG